MTPKLEEFIGAWVLERRIVPQEGTSGQFRGSARFREDKGGLVYEEKGLIKMGEARPVSTQRSYLWRPGEGGGIDVFFEDGAAFHSIGADDPSDVYEGDEDRYAIAYRFALWPEWICTWHVTGPEKDFQVVSTYRRPVEGID